MPSLYQDDHCDVVGVWVDPATQTWYGVINDEYQFEPWVLTGLTQNQRIATGRHNNRVLLASSSDHGNTWQVIDQIITDHFQPQQTISQAVFPNSTYSWGLSGTRFYVDYATGYAYVYYDQQIRNKVGDATLVKIQCLARAPLATGLKGWTKYANGRWDQPGIGGVDGLTFEPLGFNFRYDPATDLLAFEGTGKDGSQVSYRSTPFAPGANFTFSDDKGAVYIAATKAGSVAIVRLSDSTVVPSVVYSDPALGRTISVSIVNKVIQVNSTDSYGALTTFVPSSGHTVFKDQTTNRLYVPRPVSEPAFTYNVASGKYLATGYDNYAYQNTDMGSPNAWVPVGIQPATVATKAGYVSQLDVGSLAQQNYRSRTYAVFSDLYLSFDVVSMTPHSASQTSYAAQVVYNDAAGQPLTTTKTYSIKIGGAVLPSTWIVEPLMDTYQTAYPTGFFRLQQNGLYLQAAGSTVQGQRAWGAVTSTTGKQPDYDPTGNAGWGSPGGSDIWFLYPIASSSSTDLTQATGYKLVNRNSGLVLQVVNGSFVTVPNQVSQTAQQDVVFSAV